MIKIATDAGGTFTDLVAFNEESGAILVGKALDHAAGSLDRRPRHHPSGQ